MFPTLLRQNGAPSIARELSWSTAPRIAAFVTILLPFSTQAVVASTADSSPALDEVVVTANHIYATPMTTTGEKLPTPILKIPQAVQSIPEQLIRDQGITGFNEILQDAAGVAPASSPAEYGGEFRVRGFSTGPLRDGEPDTWGLQGGGARDLFVNLERVEVLKGPGSVTYGGGQDGAFGGVINLVSKRPLDVTRQEYGLTVDRFGYASPTFDVTGPINDGKTALFRLTGQYAHRGSFINHFTDDSLGLYPTFLLKSPSGSDSLLVQLEYTQRRPSRYFGLPPDGTNPGPVQVSAPYDAYYSEPGLRRIPNEDRIVTLTWEHHLNDVWTSHLILRGFDQYTEWEGAAITGIEADGRTLDRQYQHYGEHDQDGTVDAFISGSAKFLGVEHKLLLGVSEVNYHGRTFFATGTIGSIDLYHPVYGAVQSDVSYYPFYRDDSDYYGVYFQDQVALTSRFHIVLGGRYQSYRDYIRNDDQVSEDRTGRAYIPRVGATFEFMPGTVVYAGYSKGLQPTFGTYAPGYSPKPESSEQAEVGVKLELPAGVSATIALFDLKKINGPVTDPANPLFSIQAGEQRSTGGELDATWSGPQGLSAYLSYGHTFARVTADDYLPVGDQLQNTPRNAGRLWMVWSPAGGSLQHWQFGLGVYAADTRQGTLPNSYYLPGYATFDAMVGRQLGRLSVQLNLKNLADRRYLESTGVYQEGVFPGQPFNAQLSLRGTF